MITEIMLFITGVLLGAVVGWWRGYRDAKQIWKQSSDSYREMWEQESNFSSRMMQFALAAFAYRASPTTKPKKKLAGGEEQPS